MSCVAENAASSIARKAIASSDVEGDRPAIPTSAAMIAICIANIQLRRRPTPGLERRCRQRQRKAGRKAQERDRGQRTCALLAVRSKHQAIETMTLAPLRARWRRQFI